MVKNNTQWYKCLSVENQTQSDNLCLKLHICQIKPDLPYLKFLPSYTSYLLW